MYSQWECQENVNVFSRTVLTGDTIFTSPTGDGNAIVCATRRSSHLQGNGSTYISQLFLDPEYCSGPGNWTRELPLYNKALYSTKEALISSEELFYRCVYFN